VQVRHLRATLAEERRRRTFVETPADRPSSQFETADASSFAVRH